MTLFVKKPFQCYKQQQVVLDAVSHDWEQCTNNYSQNEPTAIVET